MENAPQQVPKRTSPAVWTVLAIVVITAAAGFVYYWQTTNSNTNTNSANTNAVAYQHTNSQMNTNTSVNTNGAANVNVMQNTNSLANTNSQLSGNRGPDTDGWKTYEDIGYGFSVQYPPDWKTSRSGSSVSIYKGDIKDNGVGLYVISGGLQEVKSAINAIQNLQAGITRETNANKVRAYVINVLQTSANQTYTELAIDLSNGYFIRVTPYELEPSTGFPLTRENQEVIFGIVNSFNLSK